MKKNNTKLYAKLVITGILSITLYIILFSNQEPVNQYFSKGGLFAFLPVITAFMFSFVHGDFTGAFWKALGVQEKK